MPDYLFDHVHLTSQDPLKTAEFYETLLGAKRISVQERRPGQFMVRLDLSGVTFLVSNPMPEPIKPGASPGDCGLDHIGLRTDNLETAVDELKANGVKFVREITEPPGRPGFKMSFFLAADDTLVELAEVPD